MKNRAKTKKGLITRLKKGDALDRLYAAISDYVESTGGSITVIGGVQVQVWPGDGEFKFTVGVQCLGRKPELKAKP